MFVSLACLTAGCATVRALDENGVDRGFEYFPAKPYLLIENTKEGPSARVVTLPDVTRPHYIHHDGGWGAVEFSFQLSGGMLSGFNQKQDSKGPETISAVEDLASGIASILGAAPAGGTTVVRTNVQALASDLNTKVVQPLSNHPDPTIQALGARFGAVQVTVQAAALLTLTGGDDIAKAIAASNTNIRKAISDVAADTRALADLASKPGADPTVVVANSDLESILSRLRAVVTATQDVRMYEIVPTGVPGKIEFNPVVLAGSE